MASHAPELCVRFHRASELIGRRWTGAIIFVLLNARCRFAVLREAIPDITDRMLSERLQELEEEGIVERTVVPETPVRVEYALSKKGRALAGPIEAITEWAHKYMPLDASGGPGSGSGRASVSGRASSAPTAPRTRAARSRDAARTSHTRN